MPFEYIACNAKCSMCIIKCTDTVFGAYAGAGTVHNVHCAVFRVQFAACQIRKFSSGFGMSQIKILTFTIASQKHIAILYFLGQVETIAF